MKKIFWFIVFCLICSAPRTDAQNLNTELVKVQLDSITMVYLDAIYGKIGSSNKHQRYKMYKTDNQYNLIKLDTATGRVWQVQYRMGSTKSMTVSIDSYSLLGLYEPESSGRFELYPTNNMYNFILLDTETGNTWQVQWSTDSDKRFRERIY